MLAFAAETGGNPFLFSELTGSVHPESDSDSSEPMQLHDVFAQKLTRLPPEAAHLLDVIAVSGCRSRALRDRQTQHGKIESCAAP